MFSKSHLSVPGHYSDLIGAVSCSFLAKEELKFLRQKEQLRVPENAGCTAELALFFPRPEVFALLPSRG